MLPPLYRCALCGREVSKVTRHHLVPKSEGGKRIATIEALRQQPDIARYLAWVRKQSDSKIRIRASRSKR